MTFLATDPRSALKEAVAGLLRASQRLDLAQLVEGADFEVCATNESWQIGSRTVVAQRIALVLAPDAYVRLHGDPGALEAVREGVAAVVRSFDTELADLSLFVKLETSIDVSWGRAYRSAPAWVAEEPTPVAVQHAVVALAQAYGREQAAAILERATFEVGEVGEPGSRIRRWVLRLDAHDFVRVDRDARLASQLEAMVRSAAAGAAVQVGEVVLSVGAV